MGVVGGGVHLDVAVADDAGIAADRDIHVLGHPVLGLLGVRGAESADAVAADQGIRFCIVGRADGDAAALALHMSAVTDVDLGQVFAVGGDVVGAAGYKVHFQALRHVGRDSTLVLRVDVNRTGSVDFRILADIGLHGLGVPSDTHAGLDAAAAKGCKTDAGAGGALGIGACIAVGSYVHAAIGLQGEGSAFAETGLSAVTGIALGEDALGADRADAQRLEGDGFRHRVGARIHRDISRGDHAVVAAREVGAVGAPGCRIGHIDRAAQSRDGDAALRADKGVCLSAGQVGGDVDVPGHLHVAGDIGVGFLRRILIGFQPVGGEGRAAEADLRLLHAGIGRGVADGAHREAAAQIGAAAALHVGLGSRGGECLCDVHIRVGQTGRRAGRAAGGICGGMIGRTDIEIAGLEQSVTIVAAVHIGAVIALRPGVDIGDIGVHQAHGNRRRANHSIRFGVCVGFYIQISGELGTQVTQIGADRGVGSRNAHVRPGAYAADREQSRADRGVRALAGGVVVALDFDIVGDELHALGISGLSRRQITVDDGGRDPDRGDVQEGCPDLGIGDHDAVVGDIDILAGRVDGAGAGDADVRLGGVHRDADVHAEAGDAGADAARRRREIGIGDGGIGAAEAEASHIPNAAVFHHGACVKAASGEGDASQQTDADRADADVVDLDSGVGLAAALDLDVARVEVLCAELRPVGAVGDDHRAAGVHADQSGARGEQVGLGHAVTEVRCVSAVEGISAVRCRIALRGLHIDGLAPGVDGAAVVDKRFLLCLEIAEGEGDVDRHGADRRAVEGGVGLAHTVFSEDVDPAAAERQVAAAAELGGVLALVHGHAEVDVHGRAARAAGDAEDRGARRCVCADLHRGGRAVAAEEHDRAVAALDQGNVDAGANRDRARGNGGGEDIGVAGHDGFNLGVSAQVDRHSARCRHVGDVVEAEGHGAVHGYTACRDRDAGHIRRAVGFRVHGQRLGRDAAAALRVRVTHAANRRLGIQLVDGDGNGHADGDSACRDRDGNGLRVAGKLVSDINRRVGGVDGDVLADAAASFCAVESQDDARVHSGAACRQCRRSDGGVGGTGGADGDVAGVLNGLIPAAADAGLCRAVKVSHAEGGAHAHRSGGGRHVRGQNPAKPHIGENVDGSRLCDVARHLRLHVGEDVQGRTADADTRGTARRADGDQTDIRAAVIGVAFRFGNIGIDV